MIANLRARGSTIETARRAYSRGHIVNAGRGPGCPVIDGQSYARPKLPYRSHPLLRVQRSALLSWSLAGRSGRRFLPALGATWPAPLGQVAPLLVEPPT